MTRTRRSFADEFKREAVKLCKQPGATITHIARDLGVQTSVLRRWDTQGRGGMLDLRPNQPLRSEAATEVEFGHVKVRYRGQAKNMARLHTLFELSNLWMVRRTLLQEMLG